mgnify:CR=1 FL=1
MSTPTPSTINQPAEHPANEAPQQFVVFTLSGQRYALDIMMVREIRMVSAITRLPGAAEFMRGIINLRGTIVPIFDLRKRFGLGETDIFQGNQLTVVIADVAGSVTGLLVDEVQDILTLPDGAVSPIPSTDSAHRNPFFKGLASHAGEMMIVVDLNQSIPAVSPGAIGWMGPEIREAAHA